MCVTYIFVFSLCKLQFLQAAVFTRFADSAVVKPRFPDWENKKLAPPFV